MLDLREYWQKELQEIFAKYAPEFEVWAYGSRVTGHHHQASDLDLVLINNQIPDASCKNLDEIKEALSESHIPISVDVMDWARIPEEFHRQINKHKIKLFDADSNYNGNRQIHLCHQTVTQN